MTLQTRQLEHEVKEGFLFKPIFHLKFDNYWHQSTSSSLFNYSSLLNMCSCIRQKFRLSKF